MLRDTENVGYLSDTEMADSTIPASMNGVPMDDDEFERNLKEIMDDGPNLNDLSSTVQSGSPQKASSSMTQSDYSLSTTSKPIIGDTGPTNVLTRSLTLPPPGNSSVLFLIYFQAK